VRARGQGIDPQSLYRVTSDKGEYLAGRKVVGGGRAVDILPEVCRAAVTGLSFPKKMRWGAGDFGQLGNGGSGHSPTAVTVAGVSEASSVAAGYGHTCAVVSGGTVKCWGLNSEGQLGDGGLVWNSPTAVDVIGISGATEVVLGHVHSCALVADGAVRCWGDNRRGQLGNGSTTSSGTAVAVSGVIGFVGLIAPHLARRLVGSLHEGLIPSAALMGGFLLILADLIGRTIRPPIEIPAGIVITIIGVPFFLYLLWKREKVP